MKKKYEQPCLELISADAPQLLETSMPDSGLPDVDNIIIFDFDAENPAW